MQFVKKDSFAVFPTKAHASDTGYDITVISRIKDITGPNGEDLGIVLYDTGLMIVPPENIYTEMVARSSLMKKGYRLANAIGIIDNQYRGNLCVALQKMNPDVPDLELPSRVAQLIVRRLEMVEVENVEFQQEETHQTERGEGGFGSTG